MQLIHGDCLEKMKDIPSGSVDMVLTDPPYGTAGGMGKGTSDYTKIVDVGWDKTIPHGELLVECNRVLRTNGALVLFSMEPYTSKLTTETNKNIPFSYRLLWLKDHFGNSLNAKKAPVNYTEDICVFFKKHTKHDFEGFHPLRPYAKKVMDFIGLNLKQINKALGHRRGEHFFYVETTQFGLCTEATYNEIGELFDITDMPWFRKFTDLAAVNKVYREELIAKMTASSPKVFNLPEGKKYKSNVLEYRKDYGGLHPTQKPLLLMADLIKTYTNEKETVLDFTMGSGTTGEACAKLNRDFIGIELDRGYFDIASKRIEEAWKVQTNENIGKAPFSGC